MDGDDCTTGIDCCGGFCYVPESENNEFNLERKGTCKKPEMFKCSNRDEKCTKNSDCCPPADGSIPNTCIAGFCAQVVPQ
jgi:hypothetical protein